MRRKGRAACVPRGVSIPEAESTELWALRAAGRAGGGARISGAGGVTRSFGVSIQPSAPARNSPAAAAVSLEMIGSSSRRGMTCASAFASVMHSTASGTTSTTTPCSNCPIVSMRRRLTALGVDSDSLSSPSSVPSSPSSSCESSDSSSSKTEPSPTSEAEQEMDSWKYSLVVRADWPGAPGRVAGIVRRWV
eukprot:scaffold141378_cov31-Tisochrysis_lutea.AAC.4